MKDITINVPFAAQVESGQELYAHVIHPRVNVYAYGKESKARKDMQRAVVALVDEALKTHENSAARLIACKTGEVIVVRYVYGSWQYTISRPNQLHGSSVVMGCGFEGACDVARWHAEKCYGGVVWESAL